MSQPRMKIGNWFSGHIAVIFLVVVVSATECHAEISGDPEPLKAAAREHQANREKIVTWQGKAKIEQRLLADQPLESEAVYFYDAKSGNCRWNWTITSVPKDSWKTHTLGESLNGMVKDGKYYEYRSHIRQDAKGNDVPGGDLVIKSPSQLSGHQNLVGFFDPLWHFTKPGGGKLEERLLFSYENAKHPKNTWEVSRKDNLLVFRNDGDNSDLEIKDRDHTVNHYEIDLAQGANLTLAHYYTPNTAIKTDYQITWEKVNEVWVPKTFLYHSVEMKGGQKVHQHIRRVTWTENIINEALPKDAFTTKAVGLEPGDRVFNSLTKEHYQVPDLTVDFGNPGLGVNRKKTTSPMVCPIPQQKRQITPAVAEKVE